MENAPNYHDGLQELLKWPRKLDKLQLSQLTLNPVPPSGIEELDLLSEHLHILTIEKKKAQKKVQAFSRITSGLAKYGDTLRQPQYYLDIISDELRTSEAALLKLNGPDYVPKENCFIPYLNDPIPGFLLDRLLNRYSNMAVFNNLDGEDLELTFPTHNKDERRGSHYLFVRIQALHEIFMFHRGVGSPFFSSFDIELVQSLAQYVQLTLENEDLYLETLKAKTDLSKINSELVDLAANLEDKVRARTMDLSKAKQRAEEAQQAAEHANQTKSDFLAIMSHEFRTPLNGVLGMAQLLENTELNQEQDNYVRTLANAAELMLTLVNDILDYSKIESGCMDIEHYPFSIEDTIDDVNALLAKMALDKGIQLNTQIEENVGEFLMGDRIRIRQILINLCNNAIKFTNQGSVNLKVELLPKTGWADEKVYFSITDTGIGISESNLSRLFKPFVQAETSTSREYGGTGLGLAISKRLIEAMGGEIGVHSKQGKGSVFWFILPFEEVPSALVDDYKKKRESRISSESPQSKSQSTPRSQVKILVAEDNAVNQITIEALLQKEGFQCTIADNGREALAQFQNQNWDLVLMDYFLPDMTGVEATKSIRQFELESQRAATPIIALTANTCESDKKLCIDSGMNDFLEKPIKQDKLRSVMENFLAPSKSKVS